MHCNLNNFESFFYFRADIRGVQITALYNLNYAHVACCGFTTSSLKLVELSATSNIQCVIFIVLLLKLLLPGWYWILEYDNCDICCCVLEEKKAVEPQQGQQATADI